LKRGPCQWLFGTAKELCKVGLGPRGIRMIRLSVDFSPPTQKALVPRNMGLEGL
jgi:hypothetical protein